MDVLMNNDVNHNVFLFRLWPEYLKKKKKTDK